MAIRRKTWVVLLAIVAGFLIVLAFVVPALVDLDRYRPQAIAYLEQRTGKPVSIGHLALTVLPVVSVRVDDFAVGNPPGFPPGNFVKARRIYAEVDAHALWNRQVVIKSLEFDDPVINLISDARGRWNFENPGGRVEEKAAATAPATGGAPSFTMGVVSKFKTSGGRLTLANLLPSGESAVPYFEVRGSSCTLEQFDFDAFTTSGTEPAGQGSLQAEVLRFGAVETTKVKSKLHLASKQVFLDDLSLEADGGQATGSLAFNFAGPETHFVANARLRAVNVARMLEAFPTGRGKMTGTLEGNVKLAGQTTHSPHPLEGIQGAGQLTVRNGQLPSLKLNRNLMTLARLSNLGPASGDPSSFSSMSSDFQLADQRLSSNHISITGNGVEAQGSGTLSLIGAGTLDYQGVAKTAAGQNPVTGIVAALSGATYADGKLSFPFRVSGTLDNPRFAIQGQRSLGGLPNLAGGSQPGQAPQTPPSLVNAIGDLFKKKKQ
ncbi:MAG TPA: AsmA-like C-terminal region-containing protein [Terriglobia bacterium]|nr:AsmA-like C-terminal region-containing protein [Terriglobia bacterium]